MPRWLTGLFVAIWLAPLMVWFFWDFYLSLQMFNHRIYREDQPIRGGRKFAFQTDPADYDEIGQSYRRKSIRLEIALLSWMLAPVVIFAFLGIIFTK